MDTVADVDIESTGVFKYILIRLQSGDAEKFVVRGYSDCPYHGKCFDIFTDQINQNFTILKVKFSIISATGNTCR